VQLLHPKVDQQLEQKFVFADHELLCIRRSADLKERQQSKETVLEEKKCTTERVDAVLITWVLFYNSALDFDKGLFVCMLACSLVHHAADKEAWSTDEEFTREFIAGLNPMVIKRVTVIC